MTQLTIIICALCVLLTVIAMIALEMKLSKILKGLDSSKASLPFSGRKEMAGLVGEYEKTFKNPRYTTEYAGDYINTESVAEAFNLNVKLVQTVPNLLTSLGILGTFLGLTLALVEFNSDSTDAIRSSINSLLGGMSTAFITSVFGMALSILFLVYSKIRLNKAENRVGKFASSLDQQYHASQDQVLIDAFSYTDANGNLTSPGVALASVCTNLLGVKQGVDNLGTTISDNIKSAMDDSFKTTLVPIIDELAKKMENPAQAVIDSLVKELGAICDTFSTTLTQSVSDQLDELLERFIDASNAIQQIPESVECITSANKEISAALDEQVIKFTDLSESLTQNMEGIGKSVDRIAQIQDNLAGVPDTIHTAADAISTSTHTLEIANAAVCTKIEDQMNNLLTAGQTTTQIVNDYSSKIQSIQDGLKSIFADITAGLAQYASATRDGIQQMLDPFSTSMTDATERVANSIAPLGDAVNELSTFGDTVKTTLKELENALKPVAKSIDELSKQAEKIEKKTPIVLDKVADNN